MPLSAVIDQFKENKEFSGLPHVDKRAELEDYFDVNMADDEFFELDYEEQGRIRDKFIYMVAGADPNPPPAVAEVPTEEKPDTMFSRVGDAWETGELQTELGILRSEQLLGNDTPEIRDRVADLKKSMPQRDTEERGLFEQALTASAEMAPIMLRGMAEGTKKGLALGMGAGAIAAVAGQAGPQAALPEEIITVPAVFAGMYGVGMVSGSLENIGRIEAGLAYDELLEMKDAEGNRLDPNIAKAAAGAVGIVNGAIELGQIGLLLKTIPGGKALLTGSINKAMVKAMKSGTLKMLALKTAAKYGGFIAAETAQELLQESTNLLMGEVAKEVDRSMGNSNIPAVTRDQVIDRLVDTAKQSALAFTVMGAPGTAVTAGMDARDILLSPGEEDKSAKDLLTGQSEPEPETGPNVPTVETVDSLDAEETAAAFSDEDLAETEPETHTPTLPTQETAAETSEKPEWLAKLTDKQLLTRTKNLKKTKAARKDLSVKQAENLELLSQELIDRGIKPADESAAVFEEHLDEADRVAKKEAEKKAIDDLTATTGKSAEESAQAILTEQEIASNRMVKEGVPSARKFAKENPDVVATAMGIQKAPSKEEASSAVHGVKLGEIAKAAGKPIGQATPEDLLRAKAQVKHDNRDDLAEIIDRELDFRNTVAKIKPEKGPEPTTLGGAIRAMGGINPGNLKKDLTATHDDANKAGIFKADGIEIEKAKRALVAEGWMLPSEDLTEILSDRPEELRRGSLDAEAKTKYQKEQQAKIDASSEQPLEEPPNYGKDGAYKEISAGEIPEGKTVGLVIGGKYGEYTVTEYDPFGDGIKVRSESEEVVLDPAQTVEIRAEDIGSDEISPDDIDEQANEAATSPENVLPEPTDAQKEAGNYKMGHIQAHGFDITVENPDGSVRSGVSPDGKKWETPIHGHYGYFLRSEGKDGDHVDVFVDLDQEKNPRAFVVDQVNEDGKFDEHKVILGAESIDAAKKLYLSNYEKGWTGLGDITEMPLEDLRTWLESGKQTKPVGDISKKKEPAKEQKSEQKREPLYKRGEKVRFVDSKGNTRTGTVTQDYYSDEPNNVPIMTREDGRFFITEDKVEPYKSKAAKAKPEPPAPKAEKSEDLPEKELTGSPKLSAWVVGKLKSNEAFDWRELFSQANEAWSGTQAQGVYTPKDAYDAVEIGVNDYISGMNKRGVYVPTVDDAHAAGVSVGGLVRMVQSILPTQTKRTREQIEFQQFSTPPGLAYAVNWVANLKKDDIYLEPSAGVGGIAVFAKQVADKVYVNELSNRRAGLLEGQGFDQVTTENAEQLDNILDRSIQPTVIVMNPPFSSTAGRVSRNKTKYGAQHIEQALARLEPGGRLVAIVGRGMAHDRPTFTKWWDRIRAKYNVLANVSIAGDDYRKYGTTFDNQVLVIDKTGPTTDTELTAAVQHFEDLPNILKGVRNARKEIQPSDRPTLPSTPDSESPVSSATTPAVHGDAGVDAGGTAGPAEPRPGDRDSVRPEPGPEPADQGGGPGPVDESGDGPTSDADIDGKRDSDGDRGSDLVRGDADLTPADVDEIPDAVFESYRPIVTIKGAAPHPTPLVESVAMADTAPPKINYIPKLPLSAIKSGNMSDIQLEAISYAGASHEKKLPSGERRGFFIGDNTGVGKGREIAGIIWDNWNRGRKKAVWVSETFDLVPDAKRDLTSVGWPEGADSLLPMNKYKPGNQIKADEGILFASYHTMRGVGTGSYQNIREDQPGSYTDLEIRINQVVDWLGEDFDGVIAFDESHNMANAMTQAGSRGAKPPSGMALAGIHLQHRLPDARIVYVSATGATEVSNLAYAERMGLWGEETPFSSGVDFVNQISSGGMAAMELIARNLKSLGLYTARSLSYADVKYDRLVHPLTAEQSGKYDELAGAWQIVLQNISEAVELTESSKQSANYSAFWGAQQRFFNTIVTTLAMPSVVKRIREDIKSGHAVVLQMVSTGEANLTRALSGRRQDQELEDLDMTPRENLINYLERSFPIIQYEEYEDENGNIRKRPVYDSDGEPVINREAEAMRDALIIRVNSITMPNGPLDFLIEELGAENVAEVTGRSRRLVMDEKEGRLVTERRSNKHVAADVDAFQDDKKQILVFSGKGATGRSFHADNTRINRRPRKHYLVQPGWRADKAVQGLGRTHRSNQASAPEVILVQTDLKAQVRFISSIARRLDQLGALTKGQRQTGSQGIFQARDNLESIYATAALHRLLDNFYLDRVEGISAEEFSAQTGLSLDDENPPSMTQFLNRLLSMNIDGQNTVFKAFSDHMDAVVQEYADAGTLDVGIETVTADKIVTAEKKTVHTDKDTGAKTDYVRVELTRPSRTVLFANSKEFYPNHGGYYQNVASGRIWSATQDRQRTNSSGNPELYRSLVSPKGTTQRKLVNELTGDKWWNLTEKEAKKIWNEEAKGLPKTVTEDLHLLTGNLLPIWNHISGTARINRVRTDKGERYIGRVVHPDDVSDTLDALGVSQAAVKYEATDLVAKVMNENATVRLADRWRLLRSNVSGEDRVEIRGLSWGMLHWFQESGGIVENIQYENRYFLPDNDKAADILEVIIRRHPLVRVDAPSGGARLDRPAFSRRKAREISEEEYLNPSLIYRRRIYGKYAGIVDLPEVPGPVAGALSSVMDKIDEAAATPRQIKTVLTNIKKRGTKKQLAEAVEQVRSVIADQLGELIETYRYESYHEGKVLEEKIDSYLNATRGFVSDDALQDKHPARKTDRTERSKKLPKNSRISGQKQLFVDKQRTLFSARPAASGSNLRAAAIQAALDLISATWTNAPGIRVVQHQAELPEPILREIAAIEQDGKGAVIVGGVYNKGRIYIVADNITSIKQAYEVLFHEAFGHYGVRGVLGKNIVRVLKEVYIAKRPEIQKIADEYGFDVRTEDGRLLAADEWLAREIERGAESGWVDRVVAAVRAFIRKLDPNLKFSDTEIRSLLAGARRHVTGGNRRPKTAARRIRTAPAFSSDKAAERWYSQMVRVLEQKLTNGTPKQIKSALQSWVKKGLIKEEELAWSGLLEWLDEKIARHKEALAKNWAQTDWIVSKQAVLDYLAAHHVQVREVIRTEGNEDISLDTKFSGYVVPGGENYKELLLTLPPPSWYYPGRKDAPSKEALAKVYKSTHYDEPNILAHVRFNERTDADGNRVLFLEEVQSDWHQAGRKEGYKGDVLNLHKQMKELIEDIGLTPAPNLDGDGSMQFTGKPDRSWTDEERTRWDALRGMEVRALQGTVPNAPFKLSKNWSMLVMKRMVRYAAENGCDKIAWTTGEMQVERYKEALRQAVDKIEWTKTKAGIEIVGFKNGGEVVNTLEKETAVSDAIGKSMGDSIINNPEQSGVIEGDDITISDTGMAGFYDKILPAAANKFFGKKVWGKPKVGTLNLYNREANSMGYAETVEREVWSLPITPEMRQRALREGMPLFSRKASTKKIDTGDILPKEVETRMAKSRGAPKESFLDRMKAGLKKLGQQRHHFPELQAIKDKGLRASMNDLLRRHQEIPETVKNKTIQRLQGLTENLSRDGYEVFRMNIILADMVRDTNKGLIHDKKLPFGFETVDQVVEASERYRRLADENPEVSEALNRRNSMVNDIKWRLVDAKILKKETLADKDYFHHQVLMFMGIKHGLGTGSGDVRTHWRPWMAARKGSPLDYNTEYIEAEFMAVSQQLAQLETVETLKRVKKEADIYPDLKASAKAANLRNFYKMMADAQQMTVKELMEQDDPLKPFKVNIAMANQRLGAMAVNGKLEYDSEWDDLVEELAYTHEAEEYFDDPRWFHFLSYLINTKKPGANWAATIFKAIKGRDRMIKSSLGNSFLTYKSMIPDDYTIWKPEPGKGWYWANSIADNIMQRMAAGEIDARDVEVRQVLAKGRELIWVIPQGLADTMDNFRDDSDPSAIGKAADWMLRSWKQWILLNPYSVVRYNLNNWSGDLDAAMAYMGPKDALKYAKNAAGDLWRWHLRKKLPVKVQAELDRARELGVLGSGFSVQEVDDALKILSMDRVVKELILHEPPTGNLLRRGAGWYWTRVQRMTAWRENVLRLGAYRYFEDNADKRLYGASKIDEVDGVKNPDERSAKLARELLGDYGNISKTGQWIRKRLIPFYSWLEINAPRYVYMMRNTKYENRDAGSVKKRATAVAGKKMIMSAGKLALRAQMLMGAVALYNILLWPDEERELGESGRRQQHIILGRREDGTILTLRFQGALSDALSFFGLEDWPGDVKDLIKGKRTVGEKLQDAAKALLNRAAQGIRPEVKLFAEVATGSSLYPDITRPRPIRDRVEHALRSFKLDSLYRVAAGRPAQGKTAGAPIAVQAAQHFINDLQKIIVYRNDPGILSYYDTRSAVFDWLSKQGDEKRYGGRPNKKGNALYWYKQALKFGDLDAAHRYLKKYYELGGNTRSKITSIRMAHPLSSIPKHRRKAFRGSLSPGQVNRLDRAIKWYRQTYFSGETIKTGQ
ncbi:MAG: strawberry notch family protein [Desulfosarcina sp.]|nr:strawberry notch family protein [Desulfosarcina sp.]